MDVRNAATIKLNPLRQRILISSLKQNLLIALVIAAAVLVLYDPVTHFQLINYDDPVYINAHVKQGLTWDNIVWSFTAMDAANWHPLTWISYFVDNTVFHGSPAGFHYANVLLHAVNAGLLFLLLTSATGYRLRSLLVAALFAIHPFNVQSVAWVAERKNVLSTLFFFLALLAYRYYALRPGIRRYLPVLLCFALGLMAKPMVITLPFVLLLWDLWPLRRLSTVTSPEPAQRTAAPPGRSFRVLLMEKTPMFILCGVSAFLTVLAQDKGGAFRDVQHYPMAIRFKNAAISYLLYLEKAFWPVHFSPFYSFYSQRSSHPLAQLCIALIVIALISALAVVYIRKQPALAVGWLWYLGTLVPVIGIVQVGDQGMADRYAYIPLIGIFLAVVWIVADLTSRLPRRSYFLGSISLLILVALFVDSRSQLQVWQNSVSLWSHAVQVDDSFFPRSMYGSALEGAGRGADGLSQFALVAARYPSAGARFNYAASLLRNQQPEKAIPELQEALRHWDPNPDLAYMAMRAHYHLGLAYLRVGNQKGAEEQFLQTVRMNPSEYDAYLQLGLLYQKQNRCAEAMTPLAISLGMRRSNVGLLSFGTCLQVQGRVAEARAAFQQAVQIFPDYEPAKAKLAELDSLLPKKATPDSGRTRNK